MTDLSDRPSEGNAYEPWAGLRTTFLIVNGLRTIRGDAPMPEPDWSAVWRERVKAARDAAASFGRPKRHEPPVKAVPPAGLNQKEAAEYVGVSRGTFDKWVREGAMPKPLPDASPKIWHRAALDAALLARDGEPGTDAIEPNEWDEVLQ